MHTLVVADHYIPAQAYTAALTAELGRDFGPIETVMWGGTKEEQHHLQQRMEWDGPDAVDAPAELLERVADVEVIALHFAPIGAALFARTRPGRNPAGPGSPETPGLQWLPRCWLGPCWPGPC